MRNGRIAKASEQDVSVALGIASAGKGVRIAVVAGPRYCGTCRGAADSEKVEFRPAPAVTDRE